MPLCGHRRWLSKPRAFALLRWLSIAVSTLLLSSTVVYVLRVRDHFHNTPHGVYEMLPAEVARWGASVSNTTTSPQFTPHYVFAGIQRRALPRDQGGVGHSYQYYHYDPYGTHAGSNATTAAAHVDRYTPAGETDDEPLYHLELLQCEWRELSGQVKPRHPSPASTSDAVLSFFIHGNAGGAGQGNYWTCAAALHCLHTREKAGNATDGETPAHLYSHSFFLKEEANVHRGFLLAQQADYVADAVETRLVELRHTLRQHQRTRVWLVGHSMGGVVARLAALLLRSWVPLEGVLTLNSPHVFPPLFIDRPMRQIYAAILKAEGRGTSTGGDGSGDFILREGGEAALTSRELLRLCGTYSEECPVGRHPRPKRLLSVTSGEYDLRIESSTTLLPPYAPSTPYWSLALPHPTLCGRSASHDDILRDACMCALSSALVLGVGGDAGSPPQAVSVAPMQTSHRVQLWWSPFTVPVTVWEWWGRWCVKKHAWPLGLAAMYSGLLLRALSPLAALFESALEPLWKLPNGSSNKPLPRPSRRVLRLVTLIVTHLFSDVTGGIAVVAVAVLRGATAPAAADLAVTGTHWVWESTSVVADTAGVYNRWTPGDAVASVVVILALGAGPVMVGVWAGRFVDRAVSGATRATCAVRRCVVQGRAVPRLRFVPVPVVLVLVAILLVCCIFPRSPTWRSVCWVGLSLAVAASASAHTTNAEAKSPTARSPLPTTGASLPMPAFSFPVGGAGLESGGGEKGGTVKGPTPSPVVVFALLFSLHFMGLFSIRNELLSHTGDDYGMMDPTVGCVEVLAMAFLLWCAVLMRLGGSRRASVWPSAARGWAVVCGVALAVAGGAVLWLSSSPLEAYRVLYALLWCAPAFFLCEPVHRRPRSAAATAAVV